MPKPTDAKKVLEMLYGAPKPAVSRLDMNFKDVTKRMPELQQAAKLYEQGKITREQYYAIIDQLKPVTPYEFIPKPATAEEALAALTSDKVKDFGRTDVLTPGETILSRLDIPAYSKKGTWVTSQHRLKPPADEPKTIYTPTMMLEGETKMLPGTGAARRVAKGEKQKSSFATIRGAYKPGSDEEAVERAMEALRSKDYAQIGYDPERRGFFYDRRTMEPIIGTEEGIIQIGPLVLGKKPIRGNPEDFEYKEGGAVHMQDGGSPLDRFTGRAPKRGVSSLPGYGEGIDDPTTQALLAIRRNLGEAGRAAVGVKPYDETNPTETYRAMQALFNAPTPAAIIPEAAQAAGKAATALSGLGALGVVKPKGGNWLAGSIERGLRPMKQKFAGETIDPANLIPVPNRPPEYPGMMYRSDDGGGIIVNPEQVSRLRALGEINNWIDTKLGKYVKNEMATPEDPVRALAERGVLHRAPYELADPNSAIMNKRLSSGMPVKPMGQSQEAQFWENVTDRAIDPARAADFKYGSLDESILQNNPWLEKVPDEAMVYSAKGLSNDLGFNHLIDELRNATNPDSGLPRSLQLSPDKLQKVTVPQAVELVDKINKWRAEQKVAADLKRSQNAATVEYKAYETIPGTTEPNQRGLRWVELRAPTESLALPKGYSIQTSHGTPYLQDEKGQIVQYLDDANGVDAAAKKVVGRMSLEDALKYEGETMGHCVGGYCPDVEEGRSRIYSLRDAKGEPHVTIEVQPYPYAPRWEVVKRYLPQAEEMMRARGITNAREEEISELATQLAKENMPPLIQQIKGKANRAPKDEYLPFVQDFVRSGQWSSVGDLKNTGLIRKSDYIDTFTPEMLDSVGVGEYMTKQEFNQLADKLGGINKMAAGGAVSMQDGGDPTQMFNFNPMAAKAAKQKQMRESTPETPLGALSRGFATGLFGSTEEQVPYTGSIMEGSPQRQQSQANLREIGRNIGALTDIGGMVTPFAKPATQAVTRGATALGRTGLEQVDRAMFGEGPLASLVAPVAPLQAVPRVQAPVSRLGFYDPVEQAGLNIQRKQGPGQAFLNELQRSENVSKDFLEASGIAEKLRTAPNITRDEVQAMTKGAVPEVQEVVLGSNVVPPSVTEFAKVHLPDFNPSNKDSIAKLIQVADQRYQKAMTDGDLDIAEFAEQAETEAKKLASQYESGSKPADRLSKYAEYQLPGGKNYREVLLTVPVQEPKAQFYARKQADGTYEVIEKNGQAPILIDLPDYETAQREIANMFGPGKLQSESVFRGQHWQDPNVVAHIRMNDRTDFNGKKVLFIEEMQSDWAQQGRKKGFGQEVPEGPFVKNTNEWVDLSLKNILKRAVDEGYDRVAFINGKQSADRYDLAKYVDSVRWDSDHVFMPKGAEKEVTLFMKDYGYILLPITPEGVVIGAKQGGRQQAQFNGKRLDEIVGRDVANKIMAGESGSLEGEGLSIGGEGMKKFYDQIVPDRLRKLVGKDNVKHIPGAVRHYGDADDYEIRVNRGGNSYYLYNTVTGDSLDESFNNLSDAHNFLEKLNQRNPALPQLGFDITPEIREKFSKPIPYKKGGAVRISDNPDTMLLELTNAPKMQAGGSALKAFRGKLLAQHQRSLAKDPRFKQAPGEVTNLAGKSYAQWAAEQQYKHDLEDVLARLSGVPEKKMSIQDLPVGSRLVSIVGDRTQADKILRSVNETPLANEVILHGGPRFGQGKLAQGKEDFWASNAGAAQAVQNRVEAAAERAKGKPVIGVYTAMGASDSDMYAKHFAESLIEQYPFTGMTGKQVDAFNKEFRKKYPQFAGVDNPEFVDQIMDDSKMRKAFVDEHLKKKNIEKFNIPDGFATRHAITVPELRDVPTGLAGYSVGEMKPGAKLQKELYTEHPTYDTVIPGEYMGSLGLMQDFRDLFPDATQRMLQTLRNNPKFQGPDARKPESQLFGTFSMQGAEQEVTQKLIDELAAREELIKQLGILPYKKGGKVKKIKISNNSDAMQLELMRKKKHA